MININELYSMRKSLRALELLDIPNDYYNKTDLDRLLNVINSSITSNHEDVLEKITEGIRYTDEKVAGVVNSAPEALDTLYELSAALGNNPNFSTDVLELIGTKANKDHKHKVKDIEDFPTSLPAKGGDAETLQGYTPDDFLSSNGGRVRGSLHAEGSFYSSNYFQLEAKAGYGVGVASLWYDSTNNTKVLQGNNIKDLILENFYVFHEGRKPTWNDISNKPASYTPIVHSHISSQITFDDGETLQEKLDNGSLGGDTIQVENSFNGGVDKALSAEKGKELNIKIEKLEDFNPTWEEHESNGNVTINNSFIGTTKDLVIKGKTLKNLTHNRFNKNLITKALKQENKLIPNIYHFENGKTYTITYTVNEVPTGQTEQVVLNFGSGGVGPDVRLVDSTKLGSHIQRFTLNGLNDNKSRFVSMYYFSTIEGVKISDVMIFEGIINDIPNKYFEGVASVGEQEDNKVIIKSIGKNLFDKNNEIVKGAYIGDGGAILSISDSFYSKNYIRVYEGDTFTFSSPVHTVLRIAHYDINKNFIKREYVIGTELKTTTKNGYIRLSGYINEIDVIQLEKGSVATNIEDYSEDIKEIGIPFKNGLKRIPNGVCDEIRRVEIVERVGEIILDEGIEWIGKARTSTGWAMQTKDLLNRVGSSGISDKLPISNYTVANYDSLDLMSIPNKIIFMITDNTSGLNANSTSEEISKAMSNYFKSNPTKLFYELSDPIIHKIHEDCNLPTYRYVTHITQENNIKSETSFKYAANKDATIDSNTSQVNKIYRLQTQSNSNTQRIEKLEKFDPIWEGHEGVRNITVNESLDGFTKDFSIKGRTFNNISRTKKIRMVQSNRGALPINNGELIKKSTAYTIVFDVTDLNKLDMSYINITAKDFDVETSDITQVSSIGKYIIKLTTKASFEYGGKVVIKGHAADWTSTESFIDFDNIMMFEGHLNDEDIPSQYFSTLLSIGDYKDNKVKIKSVGKNLFDKDSFKISDGSLYGYQKVNFKGVNTLSLKEKDPSVSLDNIYFGFTKKGVNANGGVYWLIGAGSVYHTKASREEEYISFHPNTKESLNKLLQRFDIQLEKGATITSHEQHKSYAKEIKIPFDNGLKGLPNGVSDEIIDDKIIQRIGKIVLNGSEDWKKVVNDAPPNFHRYYIPINAVKSSKGLCDSYVFEGGASVDKRKIYITSTPSLSITETTNIDTVNKLKDLLYSKPVTVYYELNEPVIHKMREDISIRTYNNTTHIIQENDIKSDISFKYTANKDAIIESNTSILSNLDVLQTQINHNVERIEELESFTPIWEEHSGINNVTVKDGLDGATKDLVIKGKTLFNVYNPKHCSGGTLTEDGFRTFTLTSNPGWHTVGLQSKTDYFLPLYKPNTKYTIITEVVENTLTGTGDLFRVNEVAVQTRVFRTLIKLPNNFTGILISKATTVDDFSGIRHGIYPCLTSSCTGGTIKIRQMIIEGDLSEEEIPKTYFESISSTGEQENNKIKIKSTNKNLFDEQFEQGRWHYAKGSELVKVTNPTGFRCANPIKLYPNTKYTIDFNKNTSNGYFILADSQMLITRSINFSVVDTNKTITTENNECYLVFYSVDESVRGYTLKQIEEGLTTTSYKQHKANIREIRVPFDNGLKSLPNGVEDIVIGAKALQKVGMLKIDEHSLNWVPYTNGVADDILSYYIRNQNPKYGGGILSNFFSTGSVNDLKNKQCCYLGDPGIFVSVKKTNLTTQDFNGFKKYLLDNEVEFLYELNEQVAYNLNEDASLSTYEETSHIIQENSIIGGVKFKVAKDRNAVILSNTEEIKNTKKILKNNFDYLSGKIPVYIPIEVKNPVTINDSMLGEVKHCKINGFTLQNLKDLSTTVSNGNANISNTGDIYRATANTTAASGYLAFPIKDKNMLKPNTTYTMFTSNYLQNGANNSKVTIHTVTTNVQNEFVKVRDNVFKVTTTTIDANNTMRILFYCGTTGYVEVNRKILLLEGDWTDYNIPYFEEILSLGQDTDSIKIKTTGKNLVREVLYSKGIDTASGNLGTGTNNVVDFIRVIPNTTYTFSKDGAPRAVNKFYYDANKNYLGRSSDTNSTFTIPTNCHYIRLTFGTTTPEYYLQLETGNSVSKYEDYIVDYSSVNIPFSNGLKSIPNGVCDTYENGVLTQRVEKMIIPHTYDFLIYTTAPNQVKTICFYMTTSVLDTSWGDKWDHLYCNRFKNTQVYDYDVEGIAIDSKNKLIIRIERSKLATHDNAGLKKWLQANETYVIGKLKIPRVYEVGSVLKPIMFDGTTQIQHDNNLDTDIEMLVPISLNKSLSRSTEENKKLKSDLNAIKESTLLLTNSLRAFTEIMVLPECEDMSEPNPLLAQLTKIAEDLNNI